MKLIRNHYLPDYILIEGKLTHWFELTSEQKALVFDHGKSDYSVANRPLLKRILEASSVGVAKFGGHFTGKEFLEMVHKAESLGYKVQWLLREAHGGGRGATSWGYVYFHEKNLIQDYLEERGIWEEFSKLPKPKQTSRIQKFLGVQSPLPVKPRILLVNDFQYEGFIFATPSYMEKCGIRFGGKTTGSVKSLVVPTKTDSDIYDMLVPASENKCKLPVEKLSDNIFLNENLTPEKLFSKKLKRKSGEGIGRNPRQGFDLASMLNRKPKDEWLELPKRIYEGKSTQEEIADTLFSYPDEETDTKKYDKFGQRILAGETIFTPDIWKAAQKPLMTVIRNSLQPSIKGIYGVVMPKSLLDYYGVKGERIRGWLTRFPWTLPILTTVYVWNDCLFVDEELWEIFGGDYDGDQGAVFSIASLQGDLIWERDKEWIKSKMAMPEKEESVDDGRSMEETISHILDQYEGCGRVFNSSKIVVDAARRNGVTGRELLGMEIELQARDVQPWIDGQKYKGYEGKVPTVYDMAKKHNVNAKDVNDISKFFNALRSSRSTPDTLVELAASANPNSKSWYESAVAKFKWVKPTQNQQKAEPAKEQPGAGCETEAINIAQLNIG